MGVSAKVAGASPEKKKAIEAFLKLMNGPEYAKMAIENNDERVAQKAQLINYDKSKVNPLMIKLQSLLATTGVCPIYDVWVPGAVMEETYRGLQEIMQGTIQPEALAEKISEGLRGISLCAIARIARRYLSIS